jgi:precorrin-4/cobalt-precorrin-4 C11-methyltransferase
MTVHFVGAGPGAADLITLRGLRLIERCPVCLYAGSLVPREIVAAAPPGARVIDTAPLTLGEIIAEMAAAHGRGLDVVRLHSGDPSLYGAIGEQMARLDALGIPHDVTPGVPAFAAAAAALGRELTLPELAQTVILTRTATRSSPMPPGESLERLAASGATLAIHLSIANLAPVVRILLTFYGADCPAVAARWPTSATR